MFWIGLAIVLAYVYWVHPLGFARGYSEDMCFPDFARQIMADQLKLHGRPNFVTDVVMTPFGASIPYMSWSIERDWIGAYFWMLSRDFPFTWFWFGVSMVASYAGVGYIFRRMGIGRVAAWGLALAVVVFHVPRHFKIWHHYEHQLQHWVYWGYFLDVWILHRFWRERKFSWNLELWRSLCMLGMLGTVGSFWGPMIMEWAFVRVALLLAFGWGWARARKSPVGFELNRRHAILPVVLGLVMLALDLRWFLPLSAEVKKLGEVPQVLSWFADRGFVVRPLWLESLTGLFSFWGAKLTLRAIDEPETVVTIGWFFWIPFVLAVYLLGRKKGPGLRIAAPFLALLGAALAYMGQNPPPWDQFQILVQKTIPFMNFYRVASRWGLFMPEILGAIIILAWPELVSWYESRKRSVAFKVALGVFLVASLYEVSWLKHPVNMMPPMPAPVVSMLEQVREQPGEMVLNLPFCVTGGNGVCAEQCPNYPASTTAMCLRTWHDKKVYGLYASRLMWQDCQIYNRAPFTSWFGAWREQRCLTDPEWDDFCSYLAQNPQHAAILVHPDIWQAMSQPECRAKLEERLGPALGEGSYPVGPTRGGQGAWHSRVMWYRPQCGVAR